MNIRRIVAAALVMLTLIIFPIVQLGNGGAGAAHPNQGGSGTIGG